MRTRLFYQIAENHSGLLVLPMPKIIDISTTALSRTFMTTHRPARAPARAPTANTHGDEVFCGGTAFVEELVVAAVLIPPADLPVDPVPAPDVVGAGVSVGAPPAVPVPGPVVVVPELSPVPVPLAPPQFVSRVSGA